MKETEKTEPVEETVQEDVEATGFAFILNRFALALEWIGFTERWYSTNDDGSKTYHWLGVQSRADKDRSMLSFILNPLRVSFIWIKDVEPVEEENRN